MAAETLILSSIMASAAGALSWTSRGWVGRLIDVIEKDVSAKLKAMRIQTPHLRYYLAAWMYLMVVTFIGLWAGYGNVVFATLAVLLMGPFPWYLLQRMAEQRRQKIEDQLASSMTTLSGAIRAGLSLAQALENSGRPIAQADQARIPTHGRPVFDGQNASRDFGRSKRAFEE